MTDCKIYNIPL